MPKSMMLFIGSFLAVFAAINCYIGLRTWQTLGSFLPLTAPVFGLLWFMLAAIPIVGRIRRVTARGSTSKAVALLGGYWIAITYYAFLAWLCVDVLRFLAAGLDILPTALSKPYLAGLVTWSAVFLLLAYGTWNASNPVINRYHIKIAKAAGTLRQLNAVLVSDIHLGPIIANGRLATLVERINQLEPDVIFFAGDTIDENVDFFNAREMSVILRRLKANYGSYAVLGNHEYIGGQAPQAIAALEASGLTVLRDSYRKIAGNIILAGRDDRSRSGFTNVPRAPLSRILTDVDRSLPIILLDHQPVDHAEAEQQGVDLQLAGHTHRGQFFPNNLVTRKVFAIDWGYLRLRSLQIIVSNGYGTWGPPIRIGNRPEIVQLTIDFTG